MKRIILISFIILFIAWEAPCSDIYVFVDGNGITHYTNLPTGKNNKGISSEGGKYTLRYSKKGPSSRKKSRYSLIINKASEKYNLAPSLLNAVIQVESNWNSRAVSKKGAKGLMQLMPTTAKKLNVGNPFNPEENIHGGARYLRSLLDKYNDDISLALAAYNAGPGKIEKFGGIPPIPETRNYVKRVLLLYNGGQHTPIYKIKIRNGTTLYTNIPSYKKESGFSKF
jgi:soluble lytic murein transglycosylase